MEQSLSQADSRTGRQKNPRFIWNPKIHYRLHNSQPMDPMSQMNPLNSFMQYLFKRSILAVDSPFNSRPDPQPFFQLQVFHLKFCIHFLSLLCKLYVSLIPRQSILLHLITLNIRRTVHIKKLVIKERFPASCHFIHHG